uniref:WAP domain-containing protein n=1 Tax=Amphimedon queenslandica TaxID=400682 RepID=A0A1X7VW76_AMPQE
MDMKISLALICAVMVFSFTHGSPVVHTRDNKITAECKPGYTWCKMSETCCETERCQNGYCYDYQAVATGKREKVKQSFELEDDVRSSIISCPDGYIWCSHLRKCCSACGLTSCLTKHSRKKVKQSFELEDDVRSSFISCPQRGYIWCSHLRKCCAACGLTSCVTRQSLPLTSECVIPCSFDQNYGCCNSNQVCLRTGCHPNPDLNLPPGFAPSTTNEEDRLSAPLKSSCYIPCVHDRNGCCNFNEVCLRTGCYSKVPVLGPPTTNEEDRLSASHESSYKSCIVPCVHSLSGCCEQGQTCKPTGCQSGPFANEKEKADFNELIDAKNEEYEEFDLQ